MFDLAGDITIQELSQGYRYVRECEAYRCAVCGKGFTSGEIFRFGERFFAAERAVREHYRAEHGEVLSTLLAEDKKYTGCTENQARILELMSRGLSDAEIAKEMGVASSTIRHQRFTFRERAKQAKLYLAIFTLASAEFGKGRMAEEKDHLIDIHEGATMIDERYCTTKEEERQILDAMFTSLEPLRLTTFPAKEKKKIVVLRRICQEFTGGRKYTEKEINAILREIFPDFATIRRYLIEYGLMDRTRNGSAYWLKSEE